MGCCCNSRPEEEPKILENSSADRDELLEYVKTAPTKDPSTQPSLNKEFTLKKPTIHQNTKRHNWDSLAKYLQGSIRQNYTTVKTLCKGTVKEVFIVIDKRIGLKRILKKYPKSQITPEIRTKFLKRIERLKMMDHPNIAKIYELIESPLYFYVISEWFSGGELLRKITNDSFLSDSVAIQCMIDIFDGLNYLHKRGIIHANLKPESLFFESKAQDSRLKIADFDLSIHILGNTSKQSIHSIYFIAPEVLTGEFDEKCDLWSAGVILHIMLTGRLPFVGNTGEDVINSIKLGLDFDGPEWIQSPESARDLLKKLLVFNPNERISAEQALEHPWIKSNIQNITSENPIYSDALNQLRKIRIKSKFEKCILSFIASHILTAEDEKELSKLFQELDTNKDGKISKEELIEGYGRMEVDFNIDIDAIMKNCDTNENGTIEFSEFLATAINWNKMISKEMVEKVFKLYDITGNGMLNLTELQYSMPMVPKKELKKFIRLIDTNHDRVISYEEFVVFIKKRILKEKEFN
ncbi:unnamed protein product [Blepharisma stoltei]|uniref:Calcium-dependent protein kinase n=1 Tax=Blepharisma stoltei TaxID=1481888 RepID=A0AAU9IVY6_9CILI|nr:unnamed protein product [Blepharisma stoltei]